MRVFLGYDDYKRKHHSQDVPVYWDPSSIINPHILVCGKSGTGKSTRLKQMIAEAVATAGDEFERYHNLDVHGDLVIEGESRVRFDGETRYGYQSFPASDGSLIVAVGNDRQFRAMCEALGLINLPDDERYRRNADRLKNRESLVGVLSARFEEEERDTWLKLLESVGVPCGPIQSIPEALEDPHIRAREMVFSLPHSSGASAPQVANPIKFSRSSIDYLRAPPALGEHTETILKNELGKSVEQIEAMRRDGTI